MFEADNLLGLPRRLGSRNEGGLEGGILLANPIQDRNGSCSSL